MKKIVRERWRFIGKRAELAVKNCGGFCRRGLTWLVPLVGALGGVVMLIYRAFFDADDDSSLKEICMKDYKDLLYKEEEIESICLAKRQEEVERLERINAVKLAGQFGAVCDAVAEGRIRLEQRFYAAAGLDPCRD